MTSFDLKVIMSFYSFQFFVDTGIIIQIILCISLFLWIEESFVDELSPTVVCGVFFSWASLKVSSTDSFVVKPMFFFLCYFCTLFKLFITSSSLFRVANWFVDYKVLLFCWDCFLFQTCYCLYLPWYLLFPPPFFVFCSQKSSTSLLLSFFLAFWGWFPFPSIALSPFSYIAVVSFLLSSPSLFYYYSFFRCNSG